MNNQSGQTRKLQEARKTVFRRIQWLEEDTVLPRSKRQKQLEKYCRTAKQLETVTVSPPRCQYCGEPIPELRLAVTPFARFCGYHCALTDYALSKV